MKWILRHQWLSFRRSPSFEKDIWIKIFLLLLGLLVLLNLIVVSANLADVLNQLGVTTAPHVLASELLLYYFVTELALRYLMQTVPVLDIEPYLHLPISKKLMGKFLIIRSILSPYNLLGPAVFIPLTITTFIPAVGIEKSLAWLAFTLCISLSMHFFNILFKKKLETKTAAWLAIGLLILTNYIGEQYFNFTLLPLGDWAMTIYNSPILLLIPFALLSFLAITCFRFFNQNFYVEDLSDAKILSGERLTSRLTGWESRGLMNTLIVQELKLILRHKRSRSTLLVGALFLFYPLLFINRGNPEEGTSEIIMVFTGIFFTGIFALQYGQFLWSWNTNQMDFFLTKINPYTYWVESRYRLLIYSILVTIVLSIPYAYFGIDLMLFMGATALYNVGINSMLIMRLSLWGPKAIELDKSSVMNYQGVGASQFVLGLPVILGPIIVYAIFSILWSENIGLLAIAIAGIIGIFLRKYFFNAIAKKLKADKYKLIHDLSI
jgi:hypothetical protein